MADKNQLAVYPNTENRKRIKTYHNRRREEVGHNFPRSQAAEELIEKGLDSLETSFLDVIYVELAKVCGIVGLLMLMIVALSDGGSLPFNPVYVSLVFIFASFVFMLFERFGPSVRAALPSRYPTDEDASRG